VNVYSQGSLAPHEPSVGNSRFQHAADLANDLGRALESLAEASDGHERYVFRLTRALARSIADQLESIPLTAAAPRSRRNVT
jgi:hypothetical protein